MLPTGPARTPEGSSLTLCAPSCHLPSCSGPQSGGEKAPSLPSPKPRLSGKLVGNAAPPHPHPTHKCTTCVVIWKRMGSSLENVKRLRKSVGGREIVPTDEWGPCEPSLGPFFGICLQKTRPGEWGDGSYWKGKDSCKQRAGERKRCYIW